MWISLQNESLPLPLTWGITSPTGQAVSLRVVQGSCQSVWRRKKEKERCSCGKWEGAEQETGDGQVDCVCTCRRAWHEGHHLSRKWGMRRGERYGKYKIPLREKKPCGRDGPCQPSHFGFYKRVRWTRSLTGGNVPQVACCGIWQTGVCFLLITAASGV